MKPERPFNFAESTELPMPQSVVDAGLHDRIKHCMALMDWKADQARLVNTPNAAGNNMPDGFGFKDIAYIQKLDRVFSWHYDSDPSFKAYMDQEFTKHKQQQEESSRAAVRMFTERSDAALREQALIKAETAFRDHIDKLRAAGVSENDLYALLNKVLNEK